MDSMKGTPIIGSVDVDSIVNESLEAIVSDNSEAVQDTTTNATAETKVEPSESSNERESVDAFELKESKVFDESELKEINSIGLSKEQIEKVEGLLQNRGKSFEENLPKIVEEQNIKALESMKEKFIEEAQADPLIGGDKLPEVLDVSKKVLAKYGSKELVDFLEDSGMIMSPPVLKFMANLHGVFENTAAFKTSSFQAAKSPTQQAYEAMLEHVKSQTR